MKKGCKKKAKYMDGGMVSPRKAYAMGGMVDNISPQQAMRVGRKMAEQMAAQMQPQRMVRKFRTM